MQPHLSMLEVQRNRIREGKVQRCSDGKCKGKDTVSGHFVNELFRQRLVHQRLR